MAIQATERELALLRNSINECRAMRDSLEHRLHSLECLIDDRCKFLDDTENQIGCMKQQLASHCCEIDAKEREYHAIRRSVEERSMELEAMEDALKSVRSQIGECERDLRLKEEDCNWKLEMMDQLISERDEIRKKVETAIEVCEADLVVKESRLSVLVGLIREREQELQAKHVELHNIHRECEWKEKELGGFSERIDECNKEIRVKEGELDSVRRLIDGEGKEMEFKRRNLMKEIELNKKEFDSFRRSMREKSEELEKKERKLGERVKDFDSLKKQFEERIKEFESKEKQYGGWGEEHQAKEREFEERVREFESKEKQFEVRVKEIELREKQFEGRVKDIELREKQLEGQAKDLSSKEKKFKGQVKEHESKQKQFEGQVKVLESKEKRLEGQLLELESKQKHCEGQMKKFDSDQNRFTIEVMVHKSKEKKLEAQQKMLESKEKQYDGQVQELKAKEEQFEVRAKELESKEKEFEGQVNDLESQKKQYEGQMKAIEIRKAMLNKQLEKNMSKENQLEAQMKDLESKRNQYEEQVKELELKEAQFRLALKKLESEENQFEGRLKDLQSKQNQLGRQQKELELKEKRFESLRKSFEEGHVLKEKSNILLHQVKAEPQDFSDANSVSLCKNLQLLFNLLKDYLLLCSQVSDALQTLADPGIVVLDTIKGYCPPQLRQELAECDSNLSRRLRNLLIDELKKSSPVISSFVKQEAIKFASDWMENLMVPNVDCLEILDFLKFVSTYEIGSSFYGHELQRLLDIIVPHCQSPQTHCDIEKLPDNQISPTTTYDGRNLQFLSNEPELIRSDILACLQTSADPATLVLDIIQNPTAPQDRKGNEGIIIDETHISLLDQLMRISPSPFIKPRIRDAAKKLAVALKANMNPSDENSFMVLGFLQLLSIYGLVSFFDEDEVYKLFEFVAQHKQTVELFRTLGFADKIAVFVQNLVEKKQYVDAARFICAYKLDDKINPIDLLRFEISRAERISKKFRKKPIEQKVRCKELELGILRKVRQCISDNNLESQDLVNKVQCRILLQERRREALIVLAKQKEELGRLVSKLSSALEVHQPEEMKRANKEFTENQVHQPEDRISADIAVTQNQVKVQQPKENKSAHGAVTENHVKVQQPEAQKPADRAVTMNQVQGQQLEENISTNVAVTMNQVQVQQPQEKKRPIEAVPNDYQLHQSDLDNKRPRTGATHPLPSHVFTSHYQHTFSPSEMPAPFGLPPNYYGVTGGADYFCHPRPYPAFR